MHAWPILARGLSYSAARAAALAGCGQGKDAGQLGVDERTRFRNQALTWLRPHLAAWRNLLDKEPNKVAAVQRTLHHWQQDADLAGVRDADALRKLPEAERGDWQRFWQEVEALAKRAAPPERELVPPPEEVPSP
jgi:hypothetical protein